MLTINSRQAMRQRICAPKRSVTGFRRQGLLVQLLPPGRMRNRDAICPSADYRCRSSPEQALIQTRALLSDDERSRISRHGSLQDRVGCQRETAAGEATIRQATCTATPDCRGAFDRGLDKPKEPGDMALRLACEGEGEARHEEDFSLPGRHRFLSDGVRPLR